MNKNYRQGQILKVVAAREIHTQEELSKALKSVGIAAPQVTLSRDLRDLGLLKTPQGYARAAAIAVPGPDTEIVVRDFLADVRVAQNLLVLKTPPAGANPLASALDRASWAEVIGTIAGDDTVLVVAPDAASANALRKRLLAMLE